MRKNHILYNGGENTMILFTILAVSLLILIIVTVLMAIAGTAVTFIVFGDTIICVALLAAIVRYFVCKAKGS